VFIHCRLKSFKISDNFGQLFILDAQIFCLFLKVVASTGMLPLDSGKQVLREASPRLIKQEYVSKVVSSTSKSAERIVQKPKTVLPKVGNIIRK
jgi:hypothetical protein